MIHIRPYKDILYLFNYYGLTVKNLDVDNLSLEGWAGNIIILHTDRRTLPFWVKYNISRGNFIKV